jgi:NAD(P)-dependent dehydrogenase (short-subunit alcohol dehydrogenase family)
MLLLPALEQAATDRGVATVSVHSSAALFECADGEAAVAPDVLEPLVPTRGDDGELLQPSWYDPFIAYKQSKLANVLFAQELADRLQARKSNVLVNAHAPGAVRTNLLAHLVGQISPDGPIFNSGGKLEETIGDWPRYILLKYIFPLHKVVWDPKDACLTQVYTAVADEVKREKITGKYFQSVARMIEPDTHCKNKTLQALLWTQSEKVTGSTFPPQAVAGE